MTKSSIGATTLEMPTNGEILTLLGSKIETALKDDHLSKVDRLVLETQQLFLIYISSDHQKVVTMWSVFRPMAWVMMIAAGTAITLMVSHLLP